MFITTDVQKVLIGGFRGVDDREYNNIYIIPANYVDSGKIFGGMLELRNTIETGILLFLIGYPEFMWMHVPGMVKIVIMTVTLLPILIVGLMGISGDSLVQFIIHVITFWVHRRKLHLRRIGCRYDQKTSKYKKTKTNKRTKKGRRKK